MRFSILALLLLICSTSSEQINKYQTLLDTALGRHGCLFVHSKPTQVTHLERKEMRYYIENMEAYSNQRLDTTMFSQIIQNAKAADTQPWTDNELANFFLVHEREETVSKKYALQKFRVVDDSQKKFYKKQVNKFTATEAIDRNLCYFSRPVFDNSKTHAIIQWDNGHSYLSGGVCITLYELQGKTWKEVGTISIWKH